MIKKTQLFYKKLIEERTENCCNISIISRKDMVFSIENALIQNDKQLSVNQKDIIVESEPTTIVSSNSNSDDSIIVSSAFTPVPRTLYKIWNSSCGFRYVRNPFSFR